MSTTLTMTELSRMSAEEISRDLRSKKADVAKMRLGLEMKSEKNHALYKVYRKEIARATMVLRQLQRGKVLQVRSESAKKSATVSGDDSKISSRKTSQTKKKSVKGSRS